jgi:hypothetical protein
MQSLHPDIDAAAAKARHADIRREAERWRQTRGKEQGWLSRQGCRILCQFGHLLVKLGQRLEQYGAGSAKGYRFYAQEAAEFAEAITPAVREAWQDAG